MRTPRRAAELALLLALVVAASSAHADIYGYVDERGTTHLATDRIDDRYALFMKGDGSDRPGGGADVVRPDDALTRSRLFQRLVAHPNIARFEPMIRDAALRRGLDPMLVKAMIAVESGFEPTAVSDKGAIGLMQVLPATAERYGLASQRGRTIEQRLADPKTNVDVGTRYLADLQRQFTARPELVLAAYNAGEGAVVRHRLTVPPYAETQAYVKLVDQFHRFYRPAHATGDRSSRLRVVIPARRNLPDPDAPLRWMPSTPSTAPVAAASPAVDDDRPTAAPRIETR